MHLKRQYKEEMLGMTPTNRVALTPEQQRIQELEKQLARAKRDINILKKPAPCSYKVSKT